MGMIDQQKQVSIQQCLKENGAIIIVAVVMVGLFLLVSSFNSFWVGFLGIISIAMTAIAIVMFLFCAKIVIPKPYRVPDSTIKIIVSNCNTDLVTIEDIKKTHELILNGYKEKTAPEIRPIFLCKYCFSSMWIILKDNPDIAIPYADVFMVRKLKNSIQIIGFHKVVEITALSDAPVVDCEIADHNLEVSSKCLDECLGIILGFMPFVFVDDFPEHVIKVLKTMKIEPNDILENGITSAKALNYLQRVMRIRRHTLRAILNNKSIENHHVQNIKANLNLINQNKPKF